MAGLAKLVEPLIAEQEVVGSIPKATPILRVLKYYVLPLSYKWLDLCVAWMTK